MPISCLLYTSKYEGDNTTFVWKHPCEDFNSYTQLIVHETQEAVLFLNGQALDSFGPGRHTCLLYTSNVKYHDVDNYQHLLDVMKSL